MRASGADRALACPGSLTLPAVRVRSRHTEQAAEYGTVAHGWKELGHVPPGADAKHASLLLRKLDANPVDREEWWPSDIGEHEATYALNLLTGACERYIGGRDEADAWKKAHGPGWLTGSVDYLAINKNALWVSDLKTGRYFDPDSAQLLSYLLLAWTHAGKPPGIQLAASIDAWPRYPVHSEITRHFNRTEITTETLGRLHRRLHYALKHPKKFATGDHCTYCDGQPACTVYPDYVRNSHERTEHGKD